jgi:hypothetical protein
MGLSFGLEIGIKTFLKPNLKLGSQQFFFFFQFCDVATLLATINKEM